jgi:hypothetical protein
MLLCNMRRALHARNDCTAHDNFVRTKKRGFELFRLKVVNGQPGSVFSYDDRARLTSKRPGMHWRTSLWMRVAAGEPIAPYHQP